MKIKTLIYKIKFLHLFIGLLLNTSSISAQCNRQSDSLELVNFYDAMDGKNWNRKWDFKLAMDQWYGVELDERGCVTSLILIYNNLSGNIPKSLDLPLLRDLYLNSNSLTGQIPSFSNLSNLQSLNLSYNNLSGSIPESLDLPKLRELDLSGNKLSGHIPDFSNLPSLRSLYLDNNDLFDTIPDFSFVPDLIELNLYNNRLSGQIPDFSDIPLLTSLDLGNNNLSGQIPDFSNLRKLLSLSLHNNTLSGQIPNFSKLPSLRSLHLDNNDISDSIPDFSDIPLLTSLDLGNNNLSGQIPDFSDIPLLTSLDLGNNNLSGQIPDFSKLPNLAILYLDKNNLSGQIPGFSTLSRLIKINFNGNYLSGNIPNNLVIKFLFRLDISDNRFTFSDIIPALQINTNIDYSPQKKFIVDSLFFFKTGNSRTSDLKIDSLITTNSYFWYKNGKVWNPPSGNDIHSNKLIFNKVNKDDYGRYYVRVTNPGAPQLTLESNNISLRVCDEGHDSTQLVSLYNSTNGTNWTIQENWLMPEKLISEWYGITTNSLGCVQSVHLDNNNLEGLLPVLELNTLDTLILSNNNLSGSIPEMQIPFVKQINLRNNEIIGAFPTVLHDWMDLKSLDFGQNNLTGPIPPDMGDLCELRELRLDENDIIGELPDSLTRLYNLQIGMVDFSTNNIDSLKEKIIFFCPFGDHILASNPAYDRFQNICNQQCTGNEWNMQDSVPWLSDTLFALPCIDDSICKHVSSEAGYVVVKGGIKVIYTKSICCEDSTCSIKNVETRFFDCGGKRIETAVCTSNGFCSTFGAITLNEFEQLVFDDRWHCGDSLLLISDVKDPTKSAKDRIPSISCYPNPFSAGMILQCSMNENARIRNFRIIDFKGRVYSLNWNIRDTYVEIEMPELIPGFYVLECFNSDRISYDKIVVH